MGLYLWRSKQRGNCTRATEPGCSEEQQPSVRVSPGLPGQGNPDALLPAPSTVLPGSSTGQTQPATRVRDPLPLP